MRKIQFRGKALMNDQWIFGGIKKVSDNVIFICKEPTGEQMSVDPKTVGQYVLSLDDNHATDIYEGDILELVSDINPSAGREGFVGVVHYMECGFFVMTNENGYPVWSDEYTWIKRGNIYDNPDFIAKEYKIFKK